MRPRFQPFVLAPSVASVLQGTGKAQSARRTSIRCRHRHRACCPNDGVRPAPSAC